MSANASAIEPIGACFEVYHCEAGEHHELPGIGPKVCPRPSCPGYGQALRFLGLDMPYGYFLYRAFCPNCATRELVVTSPGETHQCKDCGWPKMETCHSGRA